MPVDDTKVAQAPPDVDSDDELKSIHVIVAALKPLQEDQRTRVLEYVLGRFGAVPLQTQMGLAPGAVSAGSVPAGGVVYSGQVHDIRTLKETKNPSSANEMAALVAFYVSEVAPVNERNQAIAKADIEKYFKSAGFKLPADANFTLVNAKNAGYLDAIGGGKYKLNPVGYNLVAHRLGSDEKKKKKTRGK